MYKKIVNLLTLFGLLGTGYILGMVSVLFLIDKKNETIQNQEILGYLNQTGIVYVLEKNEAEALWMTNSERALIEVLQLEEDNRDSGLNVRLNVDELGYRRIQYYKEELCILDVLKAF